MTEALTKTTVPAAFQSAYGRPAARLFRAPARINIIGEHCDYNDGYVMPTNTALYTWLAIAPRQDRVVRILAAGFDQQAEIRLDDLHPNPDGGWQEYPSGVLRILQDEGISLGGADILTSGEIPLGGGLSSSASLETVMAFAMLSCCGHDIDRSRMAVMCKAAENEFVGVACGIMDQYVISLCERGQAMMLDCRSLEFKLAPLPHDARLLIVNSGVKHSLSEGSLNTRRRECEQAVAILAENGLEIAALRDLSMENLVGHRDVLGDLLFGRCKHVVTEIRRVSDAHQAMLSSDTARLGELMDQSHESLKDDFEVSCGELDTLVEISRNCEGVFGSRMVGAGFGGCVVSLVERKSAATIAAEICGEYRKALGQDPWYHLVEASDPVMEIKL